MQGAGHRGTSAWGFRRAAAASVQRQACAPQCACEGCARMLEGAPEAGPPAALGASDPTFAVCTSSRSSAASFVKQPSRGSSALRPCTPMTRSSRSCVRAHSAPLAASLTARALRAQLRRQRAVSDASCSSGLSVERMAFLRVPPLQISGLQPAARDSGQLQALRH